ncbi:hypothetical protein BDV06DRAFT_227101 [Aspergillus oleicola]
MKLTVTISSALLAALSLGTSATEIGTKQLALGYTNNTAVEITVLDQNEPGESYCHNIPSGRVNYGYLEADYDNTDDREIIVYLHP